MKRPVRGDSTIPETLENQGFSVGDPDDKGVEGVNETGTVSESGTQLTQAGSPPVHPFANDLYSLDFRIRNEQDELRRCLLKLDRAHLKNGTNRAHGKRLIGRQMLVSAGTYKAREPQWLKRSKARLAAPGEGAA